MALTRIHRASADPGLDVTIGPQPAHIWASPSPPPRNSLLRLAHQTVERLCDIDAEPVLIHGDFFSGNLVWSRGRLTGVVDWRSVGRALAAVRLVARHDNASQGGAVGSQV